MKAKGKIEYKLMAEIYLTDQNEPRTNIDCGDKKRIWKNKVNLGNQFSFYPGEEEVLIFPFFTFLVANVLRVKVFDEK